MGRQMHHITERGKNPFNLVQAPNAMRQKYEQATKINCAGVHLRQYTQTKLAATLEPRNPSVVGPTQRYTAMKPSILLATLYLVVNVAGDPPVMRSHLVAQPEPHDTTDTTKTLSARKLLELKRFGIGARPEKTEAKKPPTAAPLESTPTGEPDDEDDDTEEEDEAMAFVPEKTTPLSSAKSYINEFFIALSRDRINEPVIAQSYVGPMLPQGKLSTRIKSYGDVIANENNLRPFTRTILEENREDDSRYNDVDYRQYGPNSAKHRKLKTAMAWDMKDLETDRFVDYLKTQGFEDSELQFLFNHDLNYGFEDIDRELAKIDRERATQQPQIIDIGGEEGLASKAVRRPTVKLHYVLVVLALIVAAA